MRVAYDDSSFAREGGEVKLLAWHCVREDDELLFGFATKEEREMFLKLTQVSGVGPKIALAILSGSSIGELSLAIASGNAKRISSIKGVGKKTAEKICVELKDKVNAIEAMQKRAQHRPTNLITEFLDRPLQWSLDDPRYDWLTEADKRQLRTKFEFDWSWILYGESNWLTMAQMASYCMCTQKDLDLYCQILWRKPWDIIHAVLSQEAKNEAIHDIFRPWAEEGNSAALAIVKQITRINEDDEKKDKAITVRLVNDLGGEDD